MLKSVATAVTRFVNDVMFPPKPEVSHEFARLHERCLSDRWEQWTSERGLSGLVLGAASAWDLGLILHCRLTGRLTFSDVEDKALHIATALGLVRARTLTIDGIGPYDVTAETITTGMIGTHRVWNGSVIYVARSDRSDRVDLYVGFHDELAAVVAPVDREAARLKAAEEADKEREAERARDAWVTREGQTVGVPGTRNLADLRVHDDGSALHGAGSGTGDLRFHQGSGTPHGTSSQRARELITEGVRDVAALARQLEREGQRVPSDSYLRRLVREGRS
ncbi:hypothetical protein [Streptomyces mirabilis]|uniref:hypothetical protein n=1 Tax=Streptomyces mirabilis TaxID=68239 RepID=UPI003323E80B